MLTFSIIILEPPNQWLGLLFSTPPVKKTEPSNLVLRAQDHKKNPKSEGLQWDLRILELDLRFRGGLGLSPIGLENFRGGLESFKVGLEI